MKVLWKTQVLVLESNFWRSLRCRNRFEKNSVKNSWITNYFRTSSTTKVSPIKISLMPQFIPPLPPEFEILKKSIMWKNLHTIPTLMELLHTHLMVSVTQTTTNGYWFSLTKMRNADTWITPGFFLKTFPFLQYLFSYTGKKIYTIKFSTKNTFSQQWSKQ